MILPQTLQKHSLFGGLEEEQIKTIFPLLQQENYEPNEMIITEGKSNDKIYFIIEGQVAVTKGDVLITRFGEGEAFGEMEVLDVMPSAASIKSLSSVKIMSISNKALREIYKLDVKIFSLLLMNLARYLCRRLRKMNERLTSASPPPISD